VRIIRETVEKPIWAGSIALTAFSKSAFLESIEIFSGVFVFELSFWLLNLLWLFFLIM